MSHPAHETHESEHQERIAHAERDLEHINRLLDFPAFEAYFWRRLKERRAGYAQDLENEHPEPRTAELRTRIREIDDILRMPAQDRHVHAQLLRNAQ